MAIPVLVALHCSQAPDSAEFRLGATRDEVLERFGPPLRKQSFVKTGAGIWGPIEDFWPRVPMGSTVEVWAYAVEGGTVELYFVDSAQRVQGIGFAPTGAVFEGGS
jgi:hypothetical protein